MAGEVEAAGFLVYPEDCDIVATLIATIEELTRGIEIETPWVVSTSPFFTGICQRTVRTDGKDADTVVQPVAGVDKPAVG